MSSLTADSAYVEPPDIPAGMTIREHQRRRFQSGHGLRAPQQSGRRG